MPADCYHTTGAGHSTTWLGWLILLLWIVPGQTGAWAAEKYALLVAVAKYELPAMNEPQPLVYPEADARDLKKLLEDSGYLVDLLIGEQATQAAIRQKLATFGDRGKDQGVIVVGLFGHGIEYARNSRSYFCPYETRLQPVKDEKGQPVFDDNGQQRIEPNPDRLISIDEVLVAFKLSAAKHRILLADCCRNDPNVARSFGSSLTLNQVPANTAILFACSRGQKAFEHSEWGHGALTKCLLEALPKEAALGRTSMGNIAAIVAPQVEALTRGKLQGGQQAQIPHLLLTGTNVDLMLVSRGGAARPPLPGANPAMNAPRTPPSPPTSVVPKLLLAPFTATDAQMAQRAWASHKGIEPIFTNQQGMRLTLIPPGEFQMGSPAGEADRYDDETQHRVRITEPFLLGVYEVTQAEWEKVMGSNPSWFSQAGGGADRVSGQNTSRFPVETVSWEDSTEFCRRLSVREGRTYRLPTEAEWEYACRAGTTTPFHFGSTLNGTQANVDGNYPYGTSEKGPYLQRTTQVGSYSANAFGLYDMTGNVYEWCQDGYDETFYGKSPVDNPSNNPKEGVRVLRGGSWYYIARNSRSAVRYWNTPSNRDDYIGLRVVCELR